MLFFTSVCPAVDTKSGLTTPFLVETRQRAESRRQKKEKASGKRGLSRRIYYKTKPLAVWRRTNQPCHIKFV
jgi:hypothetical protein